MAGLLEGKRLNGAVPQNKKKSGRSFMNGLPFVGHIVTALEALFATMRYINRHLHLTVAAVPCTILGSFNVEQ